MFPHKPSYRGKNTFRLFLDLRGHLTYIYKLPKEQNINEHTGSGAQYMTRRRKFKRSTNHSNRTWQYSKQDFVLSVKKSLIQRDGLGPAYLFPRKFTWKDCLYRETRSKCVLRHSSYPTNFLSNHGWLNFTAFDTNEEFRGYMSLMLCIELVQHGKCVIQKSTRQESMRDNIIFYFL